MTHGEAKGRQGLDCEGLKCQAEESGLFPRGTRELLKVSDCDQSGILRIIIQVY